MLSPILDLVADKDRTKPRAVTKIAFIASQSPDAQHSHARLITRYGDPDPDSADVVVALGGDGFMLEVIHRFMNSGKGLFGMHRGSIGFLMNEYREENLPERLDAAVSSRIRPLVMSATCMDGRVEEKIAVNEVSIWRASHQAAKLKVMIDGKVRMEQLICDGILVATPAGSTAYNLSAHGPILPVNAPLLALTPLNPFRPRHWRGALLPNRVSVQIDIEEPERRPVNATADNQELANVVRVEAWESPSLEARMLFDRDHSWDERILAEQFRY